jgi:serine protease AprX
MRLTLTVLFGVSLIGSQAFGEKLSPELRNLPPEVTVDVIVQYRQAPTLARHKQTLAQGGELKHDLEIIRSAHYSIAAKQLEPLAADPDVEYISPDRKVFATWSQWGIGDTAIYTGNPDYGWRTVGADLAASSFGVDGTGVGVAVIDSGVGNFDRNRGK